MEKKYYSRKTFLILMLFNIISAAIMLFLTYFSISFSGEGWKDALVCCGASFATNIFNYFLPFPFFIFLIIILVLQQKRHKGAGYLMIIPAVLLLCALFGFKNAWTFWPSFLENFTGPPLITFFAFWLLITALTPFYVLVRLMKEYWYKK